MRISLAAFLVLLFCDAAHADETRHLMVGGLDRSYILHAPPQAKSPDALPLVFAFHGGGGQAPSMMRLTRFNAVADAKSFVVVYPSGVDRHWNDGRATIKNKVDDIAFVRAMLADVEKIQNIDRKRIYATGISNGALFTERLACDAADIFAAIAPVAGTLPADIAPRCQPARTISVLQIDGDLDPIMLYGGGLVKSFGGAGEGGTVLSVDVTIQHWARVNGCARALPAQVHAPLVASDRTSIARTEYTGCRDGAAVTLLSVLGGGHAWPGGGQYAPRFLIGAASRQLDASTAIANFFLAHPRA